MTREPKRMGQRHILVNKSILLLFLFSFAFAVPAVAQTTSVELGVSIANDGYVEAYQPVKLDVTITAEVLFAGRIVVAIGSSVIQVAVDVPAGTTKTVPIVAPATSGSATVKVSLVSNGETEPTVTVNSQLRMLGRTMLVAVGDSDSDLEGVLMRTRTAIAGLPVEVVSFDHDVGPLRPVQYALSEKWSDQLYNWVTGGGRVVLEGPAPTELLSFSIGEFEGGTAFLIGEGELIVVDRFPDEPDVWSRILRPYNLALETMNLWGSPESALSEAASNSGDSSIPSMSWMGAAIIVYALAVGPVNLLILRRLKKHELSWATIPLISLLALGVFWGVGRGRIASMGLTHATVAVVRPGMTDARTTFVLASGASGEYTIRLPENWVGYPTQALAQQGGGMFPEFEPRDMGGVGFGQVGVNADAPSESQSVGGPVIREDGAFVFPLPRLGYGALHAIYDDPRIPTVSTRTEKGSLVVDFENTLDVELNAFGLAGANVSPRVRRHLQPGEAETVESDTQKFGEFGTELADQIMTGGNLWNEGESHNWLWTLAQVIGRLDGRDKTYAFAWILDYPLLIEVDGAAKTVAGPAFLVFPVSTGRSDDRAFGELISVGNGWVDGDSYYQWITQADEVIARFQLDPKARGTAELSLVSGFGWNPEYSVWDWDSGEFVSYEINSELDLKEFMSVSGDVFLRIRPIGEPNWIDMEFTPTSMRLEW